MVALTTPRLTAKRNGDDFVDPVLANVRIFQGSLVVLDANGFARPAITAVGLKPRGMAKAEANNTGGANSAITVETEKGVFRFENSTAGDLIARADIETACFIVDDQTVAKTNGGATRSQAGIVKDVDVSGVWVLIG
jgi:hypothetical protein